MSSITTAAIAIVVLGLGVGFAVYTRPKEMFNTAEWPQRTPIPRTSQTPALSDQQRQAIDAHVAEIDGKTLRAVTKEATPRLAGEDRMTAHYDGAQLAKIERQHNDAQKDQTLTVYYDGGRVVYVRVGEGWQTEHSSRLSTSGQYFVEDGRIASYAVVDGGVVRWVFDDQEIVEIESRVREDDALAKKLFAMPSEK